MHGSAVIIDTMSSLKLLAVFFGVVNFAWTQDVAKPDSNATNYVRNPLVYPCEEIPVKEFNYVPAGTRCKLASGAIIERVEIKREGLPSYRGWKFQSEKLDDNFKKVVWLDLESNQFGRSFSFNKKFCRDHAGEVPSFELQQAFIKNGGNFILARSPYAKAATESKLNNLHLLSDTIDKTNGQPLTTKLSEPDLEGFTVNPSRGAKDTRQVDTSLCIRNAR